MSLETKLNALATAIGADVKSLRNLIGNLEEMGWDETPASVAAALVHIDAEISDVLSLIGLLSNLTTTDKSNLVAAINEVKASIGQAGAAIDDNAGAGDTDVVWSADKSVSAIAAAIAELQGTPGQITVKPYLIKRYAGGGYGLYDVEANYDGLTYIWSNDGTAYHFSMDEGDMPSDKFVGVAFRINSPLGATVQLDYASVPGAAGPFLTFAPGSATSPSTSGTSTGFTPSGSLSAAVQPSGAKYAWFYADSMAAMTAADLTVSVKWDESVGFINSFNLGSYEVTYTLSQLAGIMSDLVGFKGTAEADILKLQNDLYAATHALGLGGSETADIVNGDPMAIQNARGAGRWFGYCLEGDLTGFSSVVPDYDAANSGFLYVVLGSLPGSGDDLRVQRMYLRNKGGVLGLFLQTVDEEYGNPSSVVDSGWQKIGGVSLEKATDTEVIAGTDDEKYTTSFGVHAAIAQAISDLVDGSGSALDTLKELADALGNDPNFATTIATALTMRVRVDDVQTFTTAQKLQGCQNLGIGDPEQDLVAVYNAAKA